MTKIFKHRLLGASALVLAAAMTANAQDEDASAAEDGEFIGTITLGESKREVQTGTATALTVIDRGEIDDRQASTIAELIDSVPGVTLVNGSTPSGGGINIRGFGANSVFGTDQKVAVFVDGASTGSEEIYRIGTQLFTDPFLFRSVEVQRGTIGSFEYGSGIVGGIVRLETIDASDLTGGEVGFKWGQTLGYGSNKNQLNTSSTFAWQPTDNFELLGNYSYREQDNQDDGDGDEIGNSEFELPSFLVKGLYTFGDSGHAIEASYTQTETSERDVPYDTFFTTTDAFGNVDRDITSESAALTYTFAPGGDLINLEAILSYANQEIDQEAVPGTSICEGGPPFPCGFPFPSGIFGVINADLQYETTKLTVKNASFINTGRFSHDLRYGVEWLKKERLEANSAPGGEDERFAVFVINDIALAEGLLLTPALRYERQDLEGEFFDPEAGERVPDGRDRDALMGGVSLRYEFQNGLALFGGYAYTESFPILDDIPTAPAAPFGMSANQDNIDTPELNNTAEFGASYDAFDVFVADDAMAFKINYYDTTLDDVTSYADIDQIELQGVEIEASYATPTGLYFDLNANFVDGEETTESGPDTPAITQDWDRTPQDTIRLTAGQRFGAFADVSAEVAHAFERNLNVNTSGEEDDFTVLNLRATLAPQSGVLKGTQFRFGLENALDSTYTPLLATRPAPGRNFKITVSRVFF